VTFQSRRHLQRQALGLGRVDRGDPAFHEGEEIVYDGVEEVDPEIEVRPP
jgi:hypothetical protein